VQSPDIFNILGGLTNFMSNEATVMSQMFTKVKNFKKRSTAFNGFYGLNLYENSAQKMFFYMAGIGSIAGGRRPDPCPFRVPNFDRPFPLPPMSLPNNEDLFFASVKNQVEAILPFFEHISEDLRDIALNFEDLRRQIKGPCTCPDRRSVFDILELWSDANATVAAYTASSSFAPLIQRMSISHRQKLVAAMNVTSSLTLGFNTCIKCLIENLDSGNLIQIDDYCNGTSSNPIPNEPQDSCIVNAYKAIKRIIRIHDRGHHHGRRRMRSVQGYMFERVRQTCVGTGSLMSKGVAKLKVNIPYLTSIPVKTAYGGVSAALEEFLAEVKTTYDNINTIADAAVQDVDNIINATVANVTENVITNINNFTQGVVDKMNEFPCCRHHASKATELFSQFKGSLMECATQTDEISNKIAFNITTNIQMIGKLYNAHVDACDSCLKPYGNIWMANYFSAYYPSVQNQIISCTGNVSQIFLS
jgi:Special lobe-specific silk protein SSP160